MKNDGPSGRIDQDQQPHVVAKSLSDLLALERHVRLLFDMQRRDRDFANVERASQLVSRLAASSDQHIKRLKQCLVELGGHEAPDINGYFTDIVGFFAGAIDKSRNTKVSKGLCDGYASISLCAAEYAALIATANALGESSVASCAEELLADYAGLTMEIARNLPEIIVQEIGLELDAGESTASASAAQIERAWQSQNRQQERTIASLRGTIGSINSALADATLDDRQ
jgi:hypothetical protein